MSTYVLIDLFNPLPPQRFSDIFFIDASSEETITVGLSNIAVARGAGESHHDALSWLAAQHTKWLLVFDGADDTTKNLHEFFPDGKHGDILVTSRNQQVKHHARPQGASYELLGLFLDDARLLLLRTAGVREDIMAGDHATESAVTLLVQVSGS